MEVDPNKVVDRLSNQITQLIVRNSLLEVQVEELEMALKAEDNNKGQPEDS